MIRVALAAGLLLASFGAGAGAGAVELGGRVAVGNDYVYRGLRETRGGPAAEMGLDVRGETGWFAGGWVNRVDYEYDGRDLEQGYFVGVAQRESPTVAWETSVVRHVYRGNSARDYDYWEWFGSAFLGDSWSLTVGVADGWWGTNEITRMIEVAYTLPLPFGLTADTVLGYDDVSAALNEDYGHYSVGVAKVLKGFTGRISATGATSHARRVLPNDVAPALAWVVELGWVF